MNWIEHIDWNLREKWCWVLYLLNIIRSYKVNVKCSCCWTNRWLIRMGDSINVTDLLRTVLADNNVDFESWNWGIGDWGDLDVIWRQFKVFCYWPAHNFWEEQRSPAIVAFAWNFGIEPKFKIVVRIWRSGIQAVPIIVDKRESFFISNRQYRSHLVPFVPWIRCWLLIKIKLQEQISAQYFPKPTWFFEC